MDAKIVQLTPQLKAQAVDLASRVFGGSNTLNAAYLNWKYVENPYFDKPCLHVAIDDDRVVGMRGVYGSKWRFGSREPKTMPCAGDLAVDKEYRGRWIAQRLVMAGKTQMSELGYEYVLSTSAGPATRFMQLQAGCRLATKYLYFHAGDSQSGAQAPGKPNSRSSKLTGLARRVARRIRKTLDVVPFRKFDKWATTVAAPFRVTANPDRSTIADLASRFGNDERYQHVRDETYYNWRLRDPRYRFRCIFFEPGGIPEGFFILQQNISCGPLMIADWATSNIAAWESLLNVVSGCSTGKLHIASTRFAPDYADLLMKYGFQQQIQGERALHCEPGILVDSISGLPVDDWTVDGQDLLDAHRWDMRMIYADAFEYTTKR